MAERNLYKVIALFVAIFTYIFLAFSIVSYFKEENRLKKDFGFNVEEAIVVNIDSLLPDKPKPIEKLEPQPIQKPTPVTNPEPTPPKPEEKVPPIILPPDPEPAPKEEEKVEKESRDKEAKSAKDLFSTVRTDDYKQALEEKQKQDAARASRLAAQKAEEARKKAEEKRQKERQAEANRAQQLIQEMQIATPTSQQKSGEKHEFWSFVSSKIMAKWNRTVATQDGLSATVVIRIDNRGRLTYKNLKSSYNSLFDTKLKVFLDNLEYDRFPSYKHGPYIEAEFEFTDKEKGL